MKRNVGSSDRLFRALGALALLTCSVMAPLPLLVRVGMFGALGAYLMFTALAGTCFGYAIMGKSSCPTEPR